MPRSSSELDDEDTINQHRLQVVNSMDSEREQEVVRKMRAMVNKMNKLASRILTMEMNLIENNNSTSTEHIITRMIASSWSILMKMINNKPYRTQATIGELEPYTRVLGTYTNRINHLLSAFESLVRMRNMLPVTDLPIIKQYLLD